MLTEFLKVRHRLLNRDKVMQRTCKHMVLIYAIKNRSSMKGLKDGVNTLSLKYFFSKIYYGKGFLITE